MTYNWDERRKDWLHGLRVTDTAIQTREQWARVGRTKSAQARFAGVHRTVRMFEKRAGPEADLGEQRPESVTEQARTRSLRGSPKGGSRSGVRLRDGF